MRSVMTFSLHSVSLTRILEPSPQGFISSSKKWNKIIFLKKELNFECQTRKLHNFEPHKRAVFVNCVGVKAASRRKVKHFSPCPSLADRMPRMPRMPHLYNILEQLALSACCLLCWSSLKWCICRATCKVHLISTPDHGLLNGWTDIFFLPRPAWGEGVEAFNPNNATQTYSIFGNYKKMSF